MPARHAGLRLAAAGGTALLVTVTGAGMAAAAFRSSDTAAVTVGTAKVSAPTAVTVNVACNNGGNDNQSCVNPGGTVKCNNGNTNSTVTLQWAPDTSADVTGYRLVVTQGATTVSSQWIAGAASTSVPVQFGSSALQGNRYTLSLSSVLRTRGMATGWTSYTPATASLVCE